MHRDYCVSDFVTMRPIAKGLQGRDGLRFARQWAEENNASALLWTNDNGNTDAWRVDPDGKFTGWDVSYQREVSSAPPAGGE